MASGADGRIWYNISGTIGGREATGYIRSDFVDIIDYSDIMSGRVISTTPYTATALNPPSDPPVIPRGFSEIRIKIFDSDDLHGWSNGIFTIFYGVEPSGYSGWFLYENVTGRYLRYTDFLLETKE